MKTSEAISRRRTDKVLGEPQSALPIGNYPHEQIDEFLKTAGNAPFHYASHTTHHKELSSCTPWRAYKLDATGCRKLMDAMIHSGDTTKIPNMLAAADYLLQITWLPDPQDENEKCETAFMGTQRNMEHIAAASAFTQSLLIAATDAGFRTYWSSGGPLRSDKVFSMLDIPVGEILLGSIFLFPQDVGNSEIKAGGMHDRRGALEDWSSWREVE